ncbi:MAG: hypothetical protein ACRD0G_14840, partial [Acidimicrobiales bacterium]
MFLRVLACAAVCLGTTTAVTEPVAARPEVVRSELAQEGDGLRFESHAVYRLDPAAGAVHVTLDMTLTNEQPDQSGPGYIRQSFLPRIGIPTLAEATNITASRDDGFALDVSQDATGSPYVSTVVIDVSPDLYYRDTQTVHLAYDLPGQAPRSTGITRVNPAFVSIVAFAMGDPGLATVDVVVPEPFEAEFSGAELARTNGDGEATFSATEILDPDGWNVGVVARNDDALVPRRLSVGSREILLEAWPGDEEWATFVETTLQDGLPVMEDLIGQPWPRQRPLRVTETASPYIYGYAGWYSSLDHAIEIGDELDPVVVMHELSHVWFNARLFSDRWVNEAFAEEYASRTLDRIGQPPGAPEAIDDGDPGRVALNAWSTPSLLDDISAEQERYGYNASWSVLRAVTDEISIERLSEVIAAADEDLIAYHGDPAAADWRGEDDWRRLLDLLEEVGGSTTAAGLFGAYVVTEDEAAALAERAAAREALAALHAQGAGWSPPLGVRQALADWDFAAAHERMAVAAGVLAQRDEVAATVAPVGLGVAPSFERAYEG